jgi:hypothetical protein
MTSLDDFESRIIDLDKRLRPIAHRPVDITKPGWERGLTALPHPLDRAGVRPEVESLLAEVVALYQSSGEEIRQALRKLFAQYTAFAWAASLPARPTTGEGFREQLLLFSLKDQGRDSRDALLALQHLCREAKSAGVDAAPILKEVADLSSDVNKYGMGSTRGMLLNAC